METPLAAVGTGDPSSEASSDQVAMTAGVAVPRETPLKIEAPLSNCEFITKLAQHTACILSAPTSFKRCVKTTPAGCTLSTAGVSPALKQNLACLSSREGQQRRPCVLWELLVRMKRSLD
jgi:hypothetical protein